MEDNLETTADVAPRYIVSGIVEEIIEDVYTVGYYEQREGIKTPSRSTGEGALIDIIEQGRLDGEQQLTKWRMMQISPPYAIAMSPKLEPHIPAPPEFLASSDLNEENEKRRKKSDIRNCNGKSHDKTLFLPKVASVATRQRKHALSPKNRWKAQGSQTRLFWASPTT